MHCDNKHGHIKYLLIPVFKKDKIENFPYKGGVWIIGVTY